MIPMATWHLSTMQKKTIVEIEHFEKDGCRISRQCEYRTGLWSCENPSRPELNLTNPDGIDLLRDQNMWETIDLDDCVAEDWILDESLSSEDKDTTLEFIEEQGVEGLDELGWESIGAEVWLYGPLSLSKKET
jgi:hypothetical protein